jgi:hypothetical protein
LCLWSPHSFSTINYLSYRLHGWVVLTISHLLLNLDQTKCSHQHMNWLSSTMANLILLVLLFHKPEKTTGYTHYLILYRVTHHNMSKEATHRIWKLTLLTACRFISVGSKECFSINKVVKLNNREPMTVLILILWFQSSWTHPKKDWIYKSYTL